MLYSFPNDKCSDLLVKHHTLTVSKLCGSEVQCKVPAEAHPCLRAPGQNACPCLPASPSTLGWARFLHPQKSATLTLCFPPWSHLPLTSNVYFNLFSFMNDTEHLFMCLLTFSVFSFASSPFQVFVNFSIGSFAAFLPISFMELFHTLEIYPLAVKFIKLSTPVLCLYFGNFKLNLYFNVVDFVHCLSYFSIYL